MDKNFDFNEAIRQKLDHEHSVMSNRTGWHHAIQIAMFVAFYTIVASNLPFHYLKISIPVLGILYALSAIYSLWISDKARSCILMHWNRFLTRNNLKWEDFPPVSGNPLPHIEKSEKDQTIRDDMNNLHRHSDCPVCPSLLYALQVYSVNLYHHLGCVFY